MAGMEPRVGESGIEPFTDATAKGSLPTPGSTIPFVPDFDANEVALGNIPYVRCGGQTNIRCLSNTQMQHMTSQKKIPAFILVNPQGCGEKCEEFEDLWQTCANIHTDLVWAVSCEDHDPPRPKHEQHINHMCKGIASLKAPSNPHFLFWTGTDIEPYVPTQPLAPVAAQ